MSKGVKEEGTELHTFFFFLACLQYTRQKKLLVSLSEYEKMIYELRVKHMCF